MPKNRLDPPYVEAAVYAHDRREERLFEQLASALLNSTQARAEYIELALMNQQFEMVSDLADVVERVESLAALAGGL